MAFLCPLLFAFFIGAVISFGNFFLYNHTPEKWLQEWNADTSSPDYEKAQRLRPYPHLLLLFFILSLLSFFVLLKNTDFFSSFFLILFLFPLTLLFISDFFNRIIPHQYLFFLFIIDLCRWIVFFSGDFSSSFLQIIFQKLLGGLICFIFFFLFFLLMRRLKKEEALGFGDIKLLTLGAFLCGIKALPLFLFLSFFLSSLFSIPFLIGRKKKKEPTPLIPLAPFISASLFFILYFEKEWEAVLSFLFI